MFTWLKSLLSTGVPVSPSEFKRPIEPNDAPQIETALKKLDELGLELKDSVKADLTGSALHVAYELHGLLFDKEITPVDCAMGALQIDEGCFQRAIYLSDNCYETASLEDYAELIGDIIAMAHDEWPISGVNVGFGRGEGLTNTNHPIEIIIRAKPMPEPFQLTAEKQLDWSLITRLNERLPKEAQGRFALWQGNDCAVIVYLTPTQIQALNAYLGQTFFCKERAEDEQKNS